MAKPRAEALYRRVHAQCRERTEDGYGNFEDIFETRFTVRAGYTHLRGGEAVLAGRLEGRHVAVITVRASSDTRMITTDWRLIDAHDGTVWAGRDVTHETDRAFISLLCESGVAA